MGENKVKGVHGDINTHTKSVSNHNILAQWVRSWMKSPALT